MNEEMLVLEYSLSVEYEQIKRIFFLPSEPFEYEMMPSYWNAPVLRRTKILS